MAVHSIGQLPDVRVLAQSAVAASVTGTTNETTLATVTIPAGAMGPNGQIEVHCQWAVTNSANTKTLRARLGGAGVSAASLTTSAAYQGITRVANRGVANSQLASSQFTTGSTGTAANTTAIDTAAETTLTLTGQLATSTETITLESYLVLLYPRN